MAANDNQPSAPNGIKDGDILRLEVSQKYATISVVPNGNEGLDANFPRNLHNSAELFLKLAMVPQAVKLKETTDKLLEMYEGKPKTSIQLGQGCICWKCGYCGIPKDYTEDASKDLKPPGPCFHCNETDQINWVAIRHPTDPQQNLPWIELSAMTEEEAKKLKENEERELAERRAAVEARVSAALKEREETEKKKQERQELCST